MSCKHNDYDIEPEYSHLLEQDNYKPLKNGFVCYIITLHMAIIFIYLNCSCHYYCLWFIYKQCRCNGCPSARLG